MLGCSGLRMGLEQEQRWASKRSPWFPARCEIAAMGHCVISHPFQSQLWLEKKLEL